MRMSAPVGPDGPDGPGGADDSRDAQVPLRRNRRFQLLWTGATASTFGTEIVRLALPLTLLSLTDDPASAGAVAAVMTASMLVAQMPAGTWVDRHDRRKALLVAQAAQALNALTLTALLAAGAAGVPAFVAFAVVDGVCRAVLDPARTVAIRAIVPDTQLRSAFAQEEARTHFGWVLGPALGGVLYGAAALAAYAGATASLAVSWILTVCARVPRGVDRAPDPGASDRPVARSVVVESAEALRWLVRQHGLRDLTGVFMAMNLLGGAFTIPLIVHIRDLGGSESLTGALLSATGVGGLLGALASGWITTRVRTGHLAIAVPAVFGTCLVLASIPIATWWPFIPILTFSFTTPALNVAAAAATAELVPRDMLGRVGSLLTVLSFLLAPLGPLLGGALSSRIGGGPTLAVVGAGMGLTALAAVSRPDLRTFSASGAGPSSGSDSSCGGV